MNVRFPELFFSVATLVVEAAVVEVVPDAVAACAEGTNDARRPTLANKDAAVPAFVVNFIGFALSPWAASICSRRLGSASCRLEMPFPTERVF
jgi:hypothetical protein